jgi:GNAT superfamily N-acetyltransferase
VLIDQELVDRLEHTGAQLNALAADALAEAGAPGAAPATPWGAGLLVAFGPGRYVNRLCGLGTADVDVSCASQIESFFADRGVQPCIEVTPWASASLLRLLTERCYTPAAFRNVLVRSSDPLGEPPSDTPVTIEQVTTANLQRWLDVMAAANGGLTGAARATSDEYCRIRFEIPVGRNFIASVDGEPVGCGSVELADGIAWLGGMATVPRHRHRGVQAELIRHRVKVATAQGAELIASSAVPDGPSARNLVRHGFQLAYSRVDVAR